MPIDVKKTKSNLKSLNKYREINKKDLAIKVSSNKYSFAENNKIYTIPHYFIGFYVR